MRLRLRTALVPAILAAASVGPSPAGQTAAAYVVALEGRWQANGAPLAVGSPVPEAARIAPVGPTREHRIAVVAARGGAVLLNLDCARPGACDRPAVLGPARPAGDDAEASWLRRVMTRLEGRPERYVATLSRAGGRPRESVLALSGEAVDLAPALAGIPAGRYAIALQRLDCRADCALPAAESLEWIPGRQAAVTVPGAGPGVHDLVLRRHDGAGLQLARGARVLLLPAAEAAAAGLRFDAWSALVNSWADGVDAAERQALLRAGLDELASRR